ncbi:MAG: chemotaxis protein CheC [Desulfocucumaceae bacterium]
MSNYPELSAIHMDALREISNIGMGNALTALAQLVNRRVNMNVPVATFMPFENTFSLVGGPEELVSCVSVRTAGEVPGLVLFLFSSDSTLKLVDMLMGLEIGTTTELDEIGQSAVMEVGNVLTGSFVSAIYSMTSLEMKSSVPLFAYDMLSAILTSLMVASGRADEQVLVIETSLFQEQAEANISGHFFMLTEPGSIITLFKALGFSIL